MGNCGNKEPPGSDIARYLVANDSNNEFKAKQIIEARYTAQPQQIAKVSGMYLPRKNNLVSQTVHMNRYVARKPANVTLEGKYIPVIAGEPAPSKSRQLLQDFSRSATKSSNKTSSTKSFNRNGTKISSGSLRKIGERGTILPRNSIIARRVSPKARAKKIKDTTAPLYAKQLRRLSGGQLAEIWNGWKDDKKPPYERLSSETLIVKNILNAGKTDSSADGYAGDKILHRIQPVGPSAPRKPAPRPPLAPRPKRKPKPGMNPTSSGNSTGRSSIDCFQEDNKKSEYDELYTPGKNDEHEGTRLDRIGIYEAYKYAQKPRRKPKVRNFFQISDNDSVWSESDDMDIHDKIERMEMMEEDFNETGFIVGKYGRDESSGNDVGGIKPVAQCNMNINLLK